MGAGSWDRRDDDSSAVAVAVAIAGVWFWLVGSLVCSKAHCSLLTAERLSALAPDTVVATIFEINA